MPSRGRCCCAGGSARSFDSDDERQRWGRNFVRMAVTFSVCEAMNSFVVGLATTALDAQVATLGTGALFLAMVLSALTLGPPVVQLLGTKMGLLTGLSLEAAYVLLFVIAARQEAGGGLQWATYLCGAACSGAGSGIAWTAQGAFFLAERRTRRVPEVPRSWSGSGGAGGALDVVGRRCLGPPGGRRAEAGAAEPASPQSDLPAAVGPARRHQLATQALDCSPAQDTSPVTD
mmetsp:Transcript_36695/g.117974  ORF Transcript_36695/g.117974 Transcript_36695/m.117974 type:complete len:232 (+) Transcript_36695:270-965(+)